MNKPLVRERSLAHQCGSRPISQQCAKNTKLNHPSDSSHAYAKNEHLLESPHGSNATENLCAAISRVPRPGKIPVVPSKPLDGLVSRAIAYLPGVMRACVDCGEDLCERMNIPVLHDDEDATETIVARAFSTNRRRR